MAEECIYYYYQSGYCCALKREARGDNSIDSDTVKRYCWGYHYDECPLYKNRDGGGGVCFLTSACVEAKGLPDDCHELTVLRRFRDNYLKNQAGGMEEIREYYRIAPAIVDKIRASSDAASVFEKIYTELVLPCVELIESGHLARARKMYGDYVKVLSASWL